MRTFRSECILLAFVLALSMACYAESFRQSKIEYEEFDRSAAQEGCEKVCSKDYQPVCGDDGRTYGNLCTLESESCSSGVKFAHEGECKAKKDCSRKCNKKKRPICGSDNKTYINRCFYKMAKCEKGIKYKHDGPCEEEPIVEPTTAAPQDLARHCWW